MTGLYCGHGKLAKVMKFLMTGLYVVMENLEKSSHGILIDRVICDHGKLGKVMKF